MGLRPPHFNKKEPPVRVDDYKNACRIAAEELSAKDPAAVADAAGATLLSAPEGFELDFFGRSVLVTGPEKTVAWRDQKVGEEFSPTDAVLVMHYLNGASGELPTGDMVAYRQIPGGEFYTKAFHSRAEAPLAKVFGSNPGLLTRAIAAMGGEPVRACGDEAGKFRVLPNIDITVMVHHADEEFESAGQVLFDKNIGSYFSNEDISWLGSALVYRLMGAARNLPA
ncbi:hypothetical protein C4J81_12335 [Deltaproteobacteria bacterium Smac51]|nr:hypothetical protein C4J81_12335 [Deltaproteobacteria bacterium Smac51]